MFRNPVDFFDSWFLLVLTYFNVGNFFDFLHVYFCCRIVADRSFVNRLVGFVGFLRYFLRLLLLLFLRLLLLVRHHAWRLEHVPHHHWVHHPVHLGVCLPSLALVLHHLHLHCHHRVHHSIHLRVHLGFLLLLVHHWIHHWVHHRIHHGIHHWISLGILLRFLDFLRLHFFSLLVSLLSAWFLGNRVLPISLISRWSLLRLVKNLVFRTVHRFFFRLLLLLSVLGHLVLVTRHLLLVHHLHFLEICHHVLHLGLLGIHRRFFSFSGICYLVRVCCFLKARGQRPSHQRTSWSRNSCINLGFCFLFLLLQVIC